MTVAVVLLAGGVGGAKMAEGLAHCPDVDLTIIGNVADDDEFHGLWVSPDIDTMMYTLSDRIDRNQGWGVKDEGLRALNVLSELGQDTWMTLGDRDFGLHIYRTMRLAQGLGRQAVTTEICEKFAVPARIVLPTEDVVQTRVRTADGWLSFQEYFVREQCRPDVLELDYSGLSDARVNPLAQHALNSADVIVVAPSNPLVSIDPILGVDGIGAALQNAKAPKIAISPLVGGKAIKGPLDRMMSTLGNGATTAAIAKHYAGKIDTLVIDQSDAGDLPDVHSVGLKAALAETVMKTRDDKIGVAQAILQIAHAPQRQLEGSV